MFSWFRRPPSGPRRRMLLPGCALLAFGAAVSPASPAAPRLARVELREAALSARYAFVDAADGTVTRNRLQHAQALKLALRLDAAGRLRLEAAAGSGKSFSSGWDDVGIGSGANSSFRLRELHLAYAPASGIALRYGALPVANGVSTEITAYDNNGYLFGFRAEARRPRELFFDELSATVAYLGDLNAPSALSRFDRYDEVNFVRFLASKRVGGRLSVGGEVAALEGIVTLRQALRLETSGLGLLDAVRFEHYQRVEGKKGYGFALQGEKALRPGLTLGGGFAGIDRDNGALNGDRFGTGNRVFLQARIRPAGPLSCELFFQQAVGDHSPTPNDTRFDAALRLDLLPALRRAGTFLIR